MPASDKVKQPDGWGFQRMSPCDNWHWRARYTFYRHEGGQAVSAPRHGVDNQTACKEIKEALGKDGQTPSYQVREKTIFSKE